MTTYKVNTKADAQEGSMLAWRVRATLTTNLSLEGSDTLSFLPAPPTSRLSFYFCPLGPIFPQPNFSAHSSSAPLVPNVEHMLTSTTLPYCSAALG
jgi:hypothetical protein